MQHGLIIFLLLWQHIKCKESTAMHWHDTHQSKDEINFVLLLNWNFPLNHSFSEAHWLSTRYDYRVNIAENNRICFFKEEYQCLFLLHDSFWLRPGLFCYLGDALPAFIPRVSLRTWSVTCCRISLCIGSSSFCCWKDGFMCFCLLVS